MRSTGGRHWIGGHVDLEPARGLMLRAGRWALALRRDLVAPSPAGSGGRAPVRGRPLRSLLTRSQPPDDALSARVPALRLDLW